MDKVIFNDGEEVDHADHNRNIDLMRRYLFDALGMNASQENCSWMAVRNNIARLRPFGYAGAMKRISSTVVRVNGGLWMYADFTASPLANEPVAVVGNLSAYQDLTVTGYAGLGGNARRDIIQARVLNVDEAATSQDFKDASTGALSSQTFVKRSNVTVQYALKQGTPGGFLATEPSPDSGYFKIGSVLVRSTGIDNEDEIFDWREPVGDSSIQQIAPAMWTPSAGTDWSIQTNGSRQSGTASGAELFATLQMHMPGAGPLSDRLLARRLRRVSLDCDYGTTLPSASQVKFRRVASGIPIPSGENVSSGTGIFNGEVGTLVTSNSHAQFVLYDATTSYFPLWSNGKHSPYLNGDATYGPPMIGLKFIGANANDLVYGVTWDLFG